MGCCEPGETNSRNYKAFAPRLGVAYTVTPKSQDGSYDPAKGPLFNAAAFESPASFNYYFGSGSRTENVRGFAYKGHDVSLLKNTRISEKVTFQLRGEFFNVWNMHSFVT